MENADSLLGKDGKFATRLTKLYNSAVLPLTLEEVGKAIGVTRQTFSKYLEGKAKPTIENILNLAQYFHVSADYLLGLSDDAAPNINDREIHRTLGLSDSAIWLMRHEVEFLYEYTNKDTPEEALEVQQKIYNFVIGNNKTKEEIITYAKELNLPTQTHLHNDIYSVAITLALSTPSFKTLNTLLADKDSYELGLDSACEFNSILGALEGIFRQESKSPNTQYTVVEIPIGEKPKFVKDEKGTVIRNNDYFYNLLFIELQKVLIKHRDKHRKGSGNE